MGKIACLPTARPWTRGEALKVLKPLLQRLEDEPAAFSGSDRYLIGKLKKEFGQPVWDDKRRTSADKTALSFSDGGKHIGLDLSLIEKGVLPREGKRSAESEVVLEALGAYRKSFAFDEQITFAHTGGFSRVDSIVVLPRGLSRTWRGGSPWIGLFSAPVFPGSKLRREGTTSGGGPGVTARSCSRITCLWTPSPSVRASGSPG
jgi:hypothetical protein